MKKTRIIVPGMAVIAFSTAAAIAGSVAWFTASRTVTIDAGSYAVVKTTANLEAKLFDGVGTSVTENSVTFNDRLTDASFNHLQGKIIEPNSNGTGVGEVLTLSSYDLTTSAGVASLAGDVERGTVSVGSGSTAVTKTVYSIATFDIEFSMNFGANWESAKDVGLYLDNTTASGATHAKSYFSTSGTPVTATGFRMAFYSTDSAANKRVFADLQTDVQDLDEDGIDDHACMYVADETNFEGTTYTDDLIDFTWDQALPTASTTRADAVARPDLLAIFEPAQDAVKIRFTVVCWFEGTDPNVVDQDLIANYQQVAASLVFEAVDLNA